MTKLRDRRSGAPSSGPSDVTDPLQLEREIQLIWRRNWLFLGRADHFAESRSAWPVDGAGVPLVIVRDAAGTLRVFHNVCRHRGALVVDAPCRGVSTLRCPYHAWTYGLDGALRARPHFGGVGVHDRPDADTAAQVGLLPVRSAIWRGWLFVDLGGLAPPLESVLRPLDTRLEGYGFDGLSFGGELRFEVGGNWKLVHENYIDVLHKFAVHPELERASPLRTNLPTVWEGLCLLAEHTLERPHAGRGQGLPVLPGLPERLTTRGVFAHIFPGLNIGVWPDQVVTFEAWPLAPDRTAERFCFYFAAEAAHARFESAREAVREAWSTLNREDISIIESMQRGRASPAFDGGVFSPAWDPPLMHHARLIDRLLGAEEVR